MPLFLPGFYVVSCNVILAALVAEQKWEIDHILNHQIPMHRSTIVVSLNSFPPLMMICSITHH